MDTTRREMLAGAVAIAATAAVSVPAGAASRASGHVLDDHDAMGLAELVKTRQVSASELLEAAIARAEKHNPN